MVLDPQRRHCFSKGLFQKQKSRGLIIVFDFQGISICYIFIYIYIPLDPKTTKNEGFKPQIQGLQPLKKMKVMGSHGCWTSSLNSLRHQIRLRNVPWILSDMVYIYIYICGEILNYQKQRNHAHVTFGSYGCWYKLPNGKTLSGWLCWLSLF